MDLDDVAGELYGLPADEFIAARTARVAEARKSGDRQLATAIGRLRRPTASAAIVNLLTRRSPDLLDDLLDLAAELRRAQSALAGADLRRLSTRRIHVVTALVDEGRRLAAELQQPASTQIESELTATLQAALADPEAADQVRSGRLTSALQYSGFGMLPMGGEVGPPPRRRQEPVRSRLTAVPEPSHERKAKRDDAGAAKDAAAAARHRCSELEQAAGRAEDAVETVQTRRQEAAGRISEVERLLAQARDDERQAARELRVLERDRDRAVRAAAAARQRMEQAQQALDRRTGK